MKKNTIILLLCLFFLAAKYSMLSKYGIITKDGVSYANLAKGFHTQGLKEALNITFPPLYPVLTGMSAFIIEPVYKYFPGLGKNFNFYEFCAIVTSTLFFVLLLFLVYGAGKLFFNRKIALWAAFFTMVHPPLLIFSSEVLTETLYTFLLFAGTFSLLAAEEKNNGLLTFLSSLCFSLSYFVKPEGILAGFLLLLLVLIFSRTLRQKTMHIAIFVLTAFLIMTPYILYLHKETGQILLSNKQNIVFYLSVKRIFPEMKDLQQTGMLSFMLQHPLYALKKLIYGITYVLWNLPEAFFRIFLIFFILSFFTKEKAAQHQKIIWWFVGLFYLSIAFYNPEKRYLIPFFPLLFFDTAKGFLMFQDWLKNKKYSYLFGMAIAIILMVSFLKITPEKDPVKDSIKAVGFHLKDYKGIQTIASNDLRFAFYSGKKHITLSHDLDIKSNADAIIFDMAEDKEIYDDLQKRPFLPYRINIHLNGEDFIIASKVKVTFDQPAD